MDVKIGQKLYSKNYGRATVVAVDLLDEYPILVKTKYGKYRYLSNGKFHSVDNCITLFLNKKECDKYFKEYNKKQKTVLL